MTAAVGHARLALPAISRVAHVAVLTALAVRANSVIGALGARGKLRLTGTLAVTVALTGRAAVLTDEAEFAVTCARRHALPIPAALGADGTAVRGLERVARWDGSVARLARAVESL